MATAVQLRRGTTTQNNAFTGALGEVSVDTTLDTIRVHDGSTQGGFEITSNAAAQTLTNKSLTAPTITGTAVMATLDISGDVDVDGTLETDALTIGGISLAETISDTVGAMVGSNTETGITVSYEDGDNTLDFALGAAQTTITSLLATDIKIGEDDQTKIDFETADEIHFYAANAHQIKLVDGALVPVTDNDIDLGTSSLEFKDAFFDGTVTADAFAGPLTGNVTGNASGTAATVTGAAQTNITSLGTLTALTVDNLGINGNTITANSGAVNITPAGGSAIVLDGTINVDAGVVTGATSITSTAFVGNITGNVTGNASGTALTVTQAAQTAITSVGTLTALTVDNMAMNGNTLTTTSSDYIIDASHDIVLDADGGDIVFKDGGTSILTMTNSSTDFVMTVATQDKDFKIVGDDGGSAITPFVLDMSAGGDLFLTGGLIDLKNDGSAVSQIKFYCESSNAHAQTVIGAPHSESANNVLTLPGTGGDARLVSTASTATLTNKTLTSPKVNEDVAVTSTATELNILDGATLTVAELNILDASAGNTALATDVASSSGAGTTNTAKIKHTLTLAATLADDATHADVTITNNKVLATSVVLASCSLNVDVRIHTVVAGSFKVSVTNKSGGTLADDSTMILNYRVL